MTAPTGGRWVFLPLPGWNGVTLSINNSLVPVFPAPQLGAYNIEVFTNPAADTVVGSGFQASIADFGGTLDHDFLTGTNIFLGAGAYMLLDSVSGSPLQSASRVTLGSGDQTVIGASRDTLVGGSGIQIMSALAGNETVIGGTGNESIWAGANDSIVSGTGASQQIVLTGPGTTVVAGLAGSATIAAAAADTVSSLLDSRQKLVIAAGVNDVIDLSGGNFGSAVIGAFGDTITTGGTTNIDGAAGGMLIFVGSANLSGSASSVAGNTVAGIASGGVLFFNLQPEFRGRQGRPDRPVGH
jgi:hypothetical protein